MLRGLLRAGLLRLLEQGMHACALLMTGSYFLLISQDEYYARISLLA
jgi:hypothetical protein